MQRSRNEQGEQGEHPYRPHLVCRAFVGDGGLRPLDPSTIFYESPDIWVVAPDGSDVPAVGQVNQVNVRIWNLGSAPSYGANVELFWCNPSLGVNLASATPIGAKPTSIQPGASKVLTFPWTPVFVNDGHECLIAQVYDPVSDNLVAAFNPVEDRHVAQKNLNIVPVPAGQQFDVHVFAANLTSRTQVARVDLRPVTGAELRELAQARGLESIREVDGAEFTILAIDKAPVRSRLNLEDYPVAAVFRESLTKVPQAYSRQLWQQATWALPAASLQQSAGHQGGTRDIPERSVSRQVEDSRMVEIPPRTELKFTLAIRLPRSARPGSYAAFRLIESSEKQVSGGVSFLVRAI